MVETPEPTPAPEEAPPVSLSEEPTVDLAEEAGKAAVQQTATTEQKLRSLDELDVDGAVRSQIESYVSKSVNDAVAKHDARQQQKFNDEGYMNRSQVEELVAAKEDQHKLREEARDSFLNILGSEGIHPGSESYAKVRSTYSESIEQGKLTPEILLSEAGIRTLVAMSGVSAASAEAAGTKSGLARSAPQPDGSVAYADGTLQLNAGRGETASLEDRARRAIEESLDSTR